MKILLIEDNVKLSDAVRLYLSDSGFDVEAAFNGIQAVNKIKDDKKKNVFYDCIILDRMMPMKDGIEVVKEIKDISPSSGIIMLTAKDTVEDKVAGLSAGADDYMVKPFDVKELIARIHALHRRVKNFKPSAEIISSDLVYKSLQGQTPDNVDFIFNKDLNQIEYKNLKIDLTSKEANIFSLLLIKKMEVVSKDEIFEKVWHADAAEMGEDFNPRQIDVHVHNLRSKFLENNFPVAVETVRGVGYKLIF